MLNILENRQEQTSRLERVYSGCFSDSDTMALMLFDQVEVVVLAARGLQDVLTAVKELTKLSAEQQLKMSVI